MAVEDVSTVVSAVYGIESIGVALREQINQGADNMSYFMMSGLVEALNVLAVIVSDGVAEYMQEPCDDTRTIK